jgi:hypothetical protein
MDSIENLWKALLSRDPKRILKTYKNLSNEDRKAVIDHLVLMASEDGWHPAQKHSAQIALESIKSKTE